MLAFDLGAYFVLKIVFVLEFYCSKNRSSKKSFLVVTAIDGNCLNGDVCSMTVIVVLQ